MLTAKLEDFKRRREAPTVPRRHFFPGPALRSSSESFSTPTHTAGLFSHPSLGPCQQTWHLVSAWTRPKVRCGGHGGFHEEQ